MQRTSIDGTSRGSWSCIEDVGVVLGDVRVEEAVGVVLGVVGVVRVVGVVGVLGVVGVVIVVVRVVVSPSSLMAGYLHK